MNGFTAQEYRTAAKVIRADGMTKTAEAWEKKAEEVDHRDEKLTALGNKASQLNYKDHPLHTGSQLATYLIASGWTAPEGLF